MGNNRSSYEKIPEKDTIHVNNRSSYEKIPDKGHKDDKDDKPPPYESHDILKKGIYDTLFVGLHNGSVIQLVTIDDLKTGRISFKIEYIDDDPLFKLRIKNCNTGVAFRTNEVKYSKSKNMYVIDGKPIDISYRPPIKVELYLTENINLINKYHAKCYCKIYMDDDVNQLHDQYLSYGGSK